MAALAVDFDKLLSWGDILSDRFFEVERLTVLVEACDLEPGAVSNAALAGFKLAEDQLQ